jgi:hypothetical protein
MNFQHKRLLPFAAITLIGLAGSSVAAFAQPAPAQPPAFKCEQGEWAGETARGSNDNFAGGNSELTQPSAAFQAVPNLNFNTQNVYDQAGSNYHFGDTIPVTPPAGYVTTRVRVTTRLKPNSTATNDGIDFASHPWAGPTPGARVGYGISTLPGAATWAPPHPAEVFVFDFAQPSTAVQVYGNGVLNASITTNPAYDHIEFFKAVNQNKRLDMYVQDDTSVDFVQLQICAKPEPKYDLVASKKRDGGTYILNVTNAGQPISPPGKIDVLEIVPAGLTVIAASGAPWTCPGVIFPVIGPDAFTCSYQISAVIPTGPLPPISLKTDGKPECANCMRARLYLGDKLVNEGDMKNNSSCTQ